MEQTGRIVFEILVGLFLSYSMGLLFLDAQILAIYGVWGMTIARGQGVRRALLEMSGLALLGFVVVNLQLGAPRVVLPPLLVLGGVGLLWWGLARMALRWTAAWLPWVMGIFFWWGPAEIFLPWAIWVMGALAWASSHIKIKSPHED